MALSEKKSTLDRSIKVIKQSSYTTIIPFILFTNHFWSLVFSIKYYLLLSWRTTSWVNLQLFMFQRTKQFSWNRSILQRYNPVPILLTVQNLIKQRLKCKSSFSRSIRYPAGDTYSAAGRQRCGRRGEHNLEITADTYKTAVTPGAPPY